MKGVQNFCVEAQEQKEDDWHPTSWESCALSQAPDYPDRALLQQAFLALTQRASLVSPNSILSLRKALCALEEEDGFLLQAGDCAEVFARTDYGTTSRVVALLRQMRDKIQGSSNRPVLVTGRIAGKFAKPRSQLWEKVEGQEIPSFHGEMVNGLLPSERIPDPQRMLYTHSVIQRMMVDLRQCSTPDFLFERDFFTAHEAYLLPFESALLRQERVVEAEPKGSWFGTSGHFLWIGERTRQLDGAHVHFIQALHNPIGIKVGPMVSPQELQSLVDFLNPQRILGRLYLIGRFGKEEIKTVFPPLIDAVKDRGVLWISDPMHGNTFRVGNIKTRAFADIKAELRSAFSLLKEQGQRLRGMHCEMFPGDMTECLDPERGIVESNLEKCYTTACDPRLNTQQALALAELCQECLED